MKLNKILLILLCSVTFIFAKSDTININFKNLQIMDLVKITSKVIDKNILLTTKINGKVDFISNKPVSRDDILNILIYVLESKGYTLIENDGILRIVRINDAAKYNMPVVNNKSINTYQMITEVFSVENANVDYVSSKIRHLISKSAKLVTDKNSNSIVLTDFVANIKTVKKIIDIISKDIKKHIEVVKLDNIKASEIQTDLVNVVKTIYNEKVETEKVAVLVNKDNNSIMFVGKKQNVAYLVNYLKEIDKSGSLVAKSVEVIYLKNAESKNVIKTITGIIANKKYKDPNDKPYASNDEESNSIILMGKKEELEYFTSLIDKLDVDRQQVYVKARIIEVSEIKTRDIGVKYGLLGFESGSTGLTTFSSSLNGAGTVSTLDLSSISDYGYDIATMKKGLSLGASINLLNQNGAADIVSEPSLLCINNKQSSIYVGETRSIKTGTTTTTGGNTQDTYKREDIGLTLKVKPRISNGGKVLLEINTKLEDVGQTTTNGQPNTSKKDIETTAIVNNGESIILGGYIKAKKENTEDKVPLLGDIPILGNLFKNNREVNDKINLVIVITPYIVPKSKDLTYVRDQLAQLKLLEDKYTKDTVLRLEKAKDKYKQEDIERANELKEYQKNDQTNDNLSEHEKRVKQLMGI
jgi:general secretion pathway protein D